MDKHAAVLEAVNQALNFIEPNYNDASDDSLSDSSSCSSSSEDSD
jgi:hypothetical protein